MNYVITRQQMYDLDSKTMNEYGISSEKLMETAGYTSYLKMVKYLDATKGRVLVLCGHGNNGGDGFVIARWLDKVSFDVKILFKGSKANMSPETLDNYKLCIKAGIEIIELNQESLHKELEGRTQAIVDALLGIGFSGELKGDLAGCISQINEQDAIRIAIDIPTGLDADNGISKLAFKADYTYTMASIKRGMILNDGLLYCGKIEVIDIGIPNKFYYNSNEQYAELKEELDLPKRRINSHKGDYGRALIIAGSKAFTGAAILASRSCVRIGAGLIKLLHQPGLESIFETSLLEVMTSSYDTSRFGEMLESSDVVLIGPGLGINPSSQSLLERVIQEYSGRLIIDADGLTLLSRNMAILNKAKCQILLTPHLGEFARLNSSSISEVKKDVIGYGQELVSKYKISILIKSSTTVCLNQEKCAYIVSGNDGLSTGGSGDVLAGIITGLCSQGMELWDSAVNASFYLGKLAEKIAGERATYSIIPSDLIDHIGHI